MKGKEMREGERREKVISRKAMKEEKREKEERRDN